MQSRPRYLSSAVIASAYLLVASTGPALGAQPQAQNTATVSITSHGAGSEAVRLVSDMEQVRGKVEPASSVEGLRVLVRPIKGGKRDCHKSDNWYPQDGLMLDKNNGAWDIWVKFGEDTEKDRGCYHELAAATFGAAALEKIERYFLIGHESRKWKPIPFPDPTSNRAEVKVRRKP